MTDKEDKENEVTNNQMIVCEHDPKWVLGKGVRCSKCGGKFVLCLLPNIMKVPVYTFEDES